MKPGSSKRHSSLLALKAGLRQRVRARIARLAETARETASAQARVLLERQALWQEARSVMLYAPLAGELNVWPLVAVAVEDGKAVALPRFDEGLDQYIACQVRDPSNDLERGRYGILEPRLDCPPVPLKRLDFVLVPGLAFDLRGRRLGRGKGYYDQLLAAARGTTCGVAFDQQIVREVPVEPHDADVNCILTPTRWIEL